MDLVTDSILTEYNPSLITEYSPSILIISSFIFLTNTAAAFYKQYYLYAILFGILTITSLIYHSNPNIYINIIDKIAILSIAIYGGYMLYHKLNIDQLINICIIVFTFLLVNFLYIYGYFVNAYCFHEDKCIGNRYHALMHVIGSIGHHFIIFL